MERPLIDDDWEQLQRDDEGAEQWALKYDEETLKKLEKESIPDIDSLINEYFGDYTEDQENELLSDYTEEK